MCMEKGMDRYELCSRRKEKKRNVHVRSCVSEQSVNR